MPLAPHKMALAQSSRVQPCPEKRACALWERYRDCQEVLCFSCLVVLLSVASVKLPLLSLLQCYYLRCCKPSDPHNYQRQKGYHLEKKCATFSLSIKEASYRGC